MERQELEDLWRRRLQDAKYRLVLARYYTEEAQTVELPRAAYNSGLLRALHVEKSAIEEYQRVLCIYTDFVMDGKIPDEQGKAAGAE